MACGVPALAYARGGVKEVIADHETGFLAKDRNEFSQRLTELVNDTGLRLRMGAAARARAAGLFSWERVGAETVAFYRLVMARA
jgi:glycosyltransferase involved in cell wall biosynthesis